MTRSTHVMVVEDDARIADVVAKLLATGGFSEVSVMRTAAEAEACFCLRRPGLIVVDLGLPDRDGVALIRSLRLLAGGTDPRILVLSSATSPDRVTSAIAAGADGYLFKDEINEALAQRLQQMCEGAVPLSAGAAGALVQAVRASRPTPPRHIPTLTKQEARVLQFLETGAGYGEVATELGISLNTVRTHVRGLYEKLGAENRAEAIHLARHMQLLHDLPG